VHLGVVVSTPVGTNLNTCLGCWDKARFTKPRQPGESIGISAIESSKLPSAASRSGTDAIFFGATLTELVEVSIRPKQKSPLSEAFYLLKNWINPVL